MISPNSGARPSATARSSIAGFKASTMTRISLVMARQPRTHANPAGLHADRRLLSPQYAQAFVLLPRPPAAHEQHPSAEGERQIRHRLDEHREGRQQEGS